MKHTHVWSEWVSRTITETFIGLRRGGCQQHRTERRRACATCWLEEVEQGPWHSGPAGAAANPPPGSLNPFFPAWLIDPAYTVREAIADIFRRRP